MEDFHPWVDYPGVTSDRLTIVGGLIKKARGACVALHDPSNGDNAWSLGCRAYARSIFEIKAAAQQYDWLTILPDAAELRLTFAIGGRPVRFYRGDVSTVPPRYLSATVAELQQIALFDDLNEVGDCMLRLAVVTTATGEVISIRLVEFDKWTRVALPTYEVPLPGESHVTPIDAPKPGVVLPPVTVAPLAPSELGKPATATGTNIND